MADATWRQYADDGIVKTMKALGKRRRGECDHLSMYENFFGATFLINGLYEAAALGSSFTTPDAELHFPTRLILEEHPFSSPEDIQAVFEQFIEYLRWLYEDGDAPSAAWACDLIARETESPEVLYEHYVEAAENLLAWRALSAEEHPRTRARLASRYGIIINPCLHGLSLSQ